MTLEELYLEEPLVKELFQNPEVNDISNLYPIYEIVGDWVFIDWNPLKKTSTDEKNINKLNVFLKNLPDNSSTLLFLE